MTQDEINRIIVEKGEGGCWHNEDGMTWLCGKCKTDVGWRGTNANSVACSSLNPDFSKWENFGRLLDASLKKSAEPLDVFNRVIEKVLITGQMNLIDQIPSLVSSGLAGVLTEK